MTPTKAATLLSFLGLLALAVGAPVSKGLSPFSTVDVCAPFNVQIAPGDNYTLDIDAERQVQEAVTGTVSGDTLFLESGPFTTSQPIQVTVRLPGDKLATVNHLGGLRSVFVAPGFNVPSFTVRTGLGSGSVYVDGLNAQKVALESSGTGELVLGGNLGAVTVSASGITNVRLLNVAQSVSLDLGGICNAFVVAASPSVNISGSASGIATVQYNQGSCSVQGISPFTSPCQQSNSISQQVPSIQWTQGLEAVGGFSCAQGINLGLTFPRISFPQVSIPAIPALTFPPLSFPTLTFPSFSFPNTPNPYTFAAPTQGGAQFQQGQVGQGGSSGQAAISGTGNVAASSMATPGSVQTSTAQNGQGVTLGTSPPAPGSSPAPASSPAPGTSPPPESPAPTAAAANGTNATEPAPAAAADGSKATSPTGKPLHYVNVSSVDLNATNPYVVHVATPGGEQFQAGQVTDRSSNAQAAARGTGPVSATSVATPGSTFTSTSQGGVDITRGTNGRKLLGSKPEGAVSGQ